MGENSITLIGVLVVLHEQLLRAFYKLGWVGYARRNMMALALKEFPG